MPLRDSIYAAALMAYRVDSVLIPGSFDGVILGFWRGYWFWIFLNKMIFRKRLLAVHVAPLPTTYCARWNSCIIFVGWISCCMDGEPALLPRIGGSFRGSEDRGILCVLPNFCVLTKGMSASGIRGMSGLRNRTKMFQRFFVGFGPIRGVVK